MPDKLRKILPKRLQRSKIWERPSKESQQRLAFDQQTVWRQQSKRRLPSLRQFKYISSFLSPRESFIMGIAIFAIVGSLGVIGFFLYARLIEPLPAEGGTYREALVGRPVYINPILASTNDVDLDLSKLIYSGLLRYDKDSNIQPDLAESFEVSEDLKTYTVTLREGPKWHDGEPVSVEDVLFTYKNIQDPTVNSPLQFSLQNVDIEILDDKNVRFTLDEPFAPFISLLTVGLLPQHIWGNLPPSNFRLAERNIKPIGSGAWQFEKLEKDKQGNVRSFTVIPFEDYHGHKPYLQEITFRFFPDDLPGAIAALNNNRVDGISFLPRQSIGEVKNAPTFQTHHLELPQYTAVFFNEEKNSLIEDIEIRQALAYGIDRKRLLKETLDGLGHIVSSPVLPGIPGFDPDYEGYPYNPVEAQRILEEAGWEAVTAEEYVQSETERILEERELAANTAAAIEESAGDEETTEEEVVEEPVVEEEPIFIETDNQALFRQKDEQFLEIKLTTVDHPETLRAAEIIQNAWRAIGFKVNLEVVTPRELQDLILPSHDYEALLFAHILNAFPDLYTFWHSSQVDYPGLNLANFSDNDADTLLAEARQTQDDVKRAELHQQFEDLLDEELPALFLYSANYTYVLPQTIKGFGVERISVPADRFNNIDEWYIKTKKRLKRR